MPDPIFAFTATDPGALFPAFVNAASADGGYVLALRGAEVAGEPARTGRAFLPRSVAITLAGRILQHACYEASKAGGWHNDLATGAPRTAEQNDALFPLRIALCHSELSEALEGHRKGLADDKLPHRPMAEVEVADAAIREFDLGGAMGFDLGAAIAEKIEFNATRSDHTAAARAAAGGKKY